MSCAEIASQQLKQYRLEPGGLICTGTATGVGPMKAGDLVQALVEGAGTSTFTIGPASAL